MGAAIAVALCASLCGPEVFLLDLAGLWEYIEVGRQGSILGNPLKVGVSLATAPHVVITLLGKFKGESGAHRDRSKVVDGAAVGGAPQEGRGQVQLLKIDWREWCPVGVFRAPLKIIAF